MSPGLNACSSFSLDHEIPLSIVAPGRVRHFIKGKGQRAKNDAIDARMLALFAAAGKKSGAAGLLNTDWGDGGHPNLLGTSFHSFAYGAEASWSGAAKTSDDFDRRFSWLHTRKISSMLGKIYRMLGATNEPFGELKSTSLGFGMYWASFPYGKELHEARMPKLNKAERISRAARGSNPPSKTR